MREQDLKKKQQEYERKQILAKWLALEPLIVRVVSNKSIN